MKAPVLPRVLLLETHFVMRRTIVSVARDLGVAEFQDASSVDRARMLLADQAYQGLVLELDEESRAMDLLSELRLGRFPSRPDAGVIVMAADLRASDWQRLQDLAVTQILRKPFRIGDLLKAIAEKA
jgi:CheY-like chemotaxis protein